MFVLSESSDYDLTFWRLLTFLKCSICSKVQQRLVQVCENAHFCCENCFGSVVLPYKKGCRQCKNALAIKSLTVFNSILDVLTDLPNGNGKFIDELVQILECPVCYEETITSLAICIRGHCVCRRCSLLTDNCPLCRDNFIIERYVITIKQKLEHILLDIPCCNQAYGCQAINAYNKVKNHMEKCSFIPWECEDRNCSWIGISGRTAEHAIEVHQNFIPKGKKVKITLNLDKSVHLQLWNRKRGIYYKVIYKMTGQGLKFVICCPNSITEKVHFSLKNENKALSLTTLCVEPNMNSSYFLTHECPAIIIPRDLVLTNRSSIECLLQIEEGKWQTVVIIFINVALVIIKLLTF